MQTLRLSTGAAALAVGSLAIFGMATPSLAQQGGPGNSGGQGNGANNPSECGVQNPAGKYPPGQCRRGQVSDNNARPGQSMSASTPPGTFDPGSNGNVEFRSKPTVVGSFTAAQDGSATATFTIPKNASEGRHTIAFVGTFEGAPNEFLIPIEVSRSGGAGGGAGAGTGAGSAGNNSGAPSSLPFTGSDDLIPLTLVGVAMVTAGAGAVVAARRRRTDVPSEVA